MHFKKYTGKLNTWSWIGLLYFIEGLPNVMVVTLSVFFYKSMGLSNDQCAFYTSLLYLPWVVKGLWSPIIDAVSTKYNWLMSMLILLSILFLGLGVSVFMDSFLLLSLSIFFVIAFASATFDISADGVYMLLLSEKQQSFFVGIRNTFYRIALIFAQGGLLWIVGEISEQHGSLRTAWGIAFLICASLFICGLLILKIILPNPENNIKEKTSIGDLYKNFILTFVEFFRKKHIFSIMLFILFYRFAESQLSKIVPLFLKDSNVLGGLQLTEKEISKIYGYNAPASLLIGGILGGICISKFGLKKMLIPMSLALNIPNLAYLYLSQNIEKNLFLFGGLISIEQFGYGFGFAGYMMFLIVIAKGINQTSHYAIATSFMALGFMLPGIYSGNIQQSLGFQNFFIWIMIATILSFAVTGLAYRVLPSKKS